MQEVAPIAARKKVLGDPHRQLSHHSSASVAGKFRPLLAFQDLFAVYTHEYAHAKHVASARSNIHYVRVPELVLRPWRPKFKKESSD